MWNYLVSACIGYRASAILKKFKLRKSRKVKGEHKLWSSQWLDGSERKIFEGSIYLFLYKFPFLKKKKPVSPLLDNRVFSVNKEAGEKSP